jgi:predicted lipoprotein with Yx(FWY)xxD motif
MKPIQRLGAIFVALAALLVAAPALADHHAVKIAKKDAVGSYLTDTKGMTLYSFKKDMPGMSHCDGACAEKWPIYFREAVAAGPGLKGPDFGTITRADGKKQTTYKGMPLYYFSGDKAAGDTNGQGVKEVWSAATP